MPSDSAACAAPRVHDIDAQFLELAAQALGDDLAGKPRALNAVLAA